MTIPNTKHLPLFCFPCGKYIDWNFEEHDNTITHRRNERKWLKKMKYSIPEKLRWKYDKDFSKKKRMDKQE